MPNSLRNRLLASYLAIILVTLGLVGLALLVFLRTRPLPTDEVVRDLAANLIDVRVTGSWEIQSNLEPGGATLRTALIGVSAYLEDQAEARNVRTLIANDAGVVFFDSAHQFEPRQTIPSFNRRPLAQTRRPNMMLSEVYQGEFTSTDGEQWIFVAQPFSPFLNFVQISLGELPSADTESQGAGAMGMGQHMRGGDAPPLSNLYLMVAQPAPHPSLREVFRLFGNNFFSPLMQAGAVGAVIAFVLAMLIARSVARPLQQMSTAAGQIAQGDFGQRVPLGGPHEVQTLARSFNSMAQRVATTQQAQRDFLANVSHDLRTPLTSIQGFSQAIAEGVTADPDSAQHAAQIIHDEAARLHRMVEGLLDMARIEAQQPDMRRRAIRVGDVLRAVSESLSVRAREKSLRLEVAIPDDLPLIAGDGDRLAQVFTNLIDNAIKHTPAGGQIALSARAEDTQIVIAVADTGTGIPQADLPRIFERFYQVDKSRQRQRRDGVGLGLAITRQIVEAHGGTLSVSSREGQGTVFTVRLPLGEPAAGPRSTRRGS